MSAVIESILAYSLHILYFMHLISVHCWLVHYFILSLKRESTLAVNGCVFCIANTATLLVEEVVLCV